MALRGAGKCPNWATFEGNVEPDQKTTRAAQRRCIVSAAGKGFQQCLLSRKKGDQATSDGSTPNPKQLSPTMS
jgi:hypothetical protein